MFKTNFNGIIIDLGKVQHYNIRIEELNKHLSGCPIHKITPKTVKRWKLSSSNVYSFCIIIQVFHAR